MKVLIKTAVCVLVVPGSASASSVTNPVTDSADRPIAADVTDNTVAIPSDALGLRLSVTANRYEVQQVWSTQQQNQLTSEQMNRSSRDQMPNALAEVPGVLVQKTNYGGGSPFLHGITGKQVLLLVDGIRLNNSLYRYGPHQYLNTVDPYLVDRIEVVHGPTSVLYGSDGLGGTINLMTKMPEAYASNQTWGTGGAFAASSADRGLRGRVQVEGNNGHSAMLAGVSGRIFGDLRGGGAVGVQHHTGYEEVDADFKWVSTHGAYKTTISSQFQRQFDVPKTSEITLDGKIKYNYEPQVRSLTYLAIESRNRSAIYDRYRATVSMQLQREGEQVLKSPTANETHELNEAHTLGVTVQFDKELFAENRLSYGAEYYQDWISSSKEELLPSGAVRDVKPAYPDGAHYGSAGVYLQDEWYPLDILRLVGGLRYSAAWAAGTLVDPGTGASNALNLNAHDFTGNLGINYQLHQRLHLITQFAKGFRAPNMEDFFGKVDFATEVPNTNLDPEKSYDFQLGARFLGTCLEAEAFYFLDHYVDLIDRVDIRTDADGDGTVETVAQRQNIGRARIWGVAGQVRWTPPKVLVLTASAGYARGDTLKQTAGSWDIDSPMRRIPPAKGAIKALLKLPKDSFLQPEYVWAATQDRLSGGDIGDARIPAGGTPGYHVFHLRSGIDLAHRNALRAGVENLLDKQYKDHGSGVWFPGRNFYLEFRHAL